MDIYYHNFERAKKMKKILSILATLLISNIAYADCLDAMKKANFAQAFELCPKEAEKAGPTQAQTQYFLGALYSVDIDEQHKADKAKSFKYFLSAAKKSYTPAYYAVSDSYYHGNGVAKDPKKSFEWAKKSAFSKDVNGAVYLSEFYRTGFGVKASETDSLLWLMIAHILSDKLDDRTQEYFNTTIGTLSRDSRVQLFGDATVCLQSKFTKCTTQIALSKDKKATDNTKTTTK